MNCGNCGAAMMLVRERDYYVCPYCATHSFPEASADGIRVVDLPSVVNCPACGRGLTYAYLEQKKVLHCTNCRGVLVNHRNFHHAIINLRARYADRQYTPRPLPEHTMRQIACPNCEEPMHTYPYYGPGNVLIDTCAECGLVWLDAGELEEIAKAPGPEAVRDDIIEIWKRREE